MDTTSRDQSERRQEQRVRPLAKRRDYKVNKSRRQWSLDNAGDFMLVDLETRGAVLGWRYDASLEEIEAFLRADPDYVRRRPQLGLVDRRRGRWALASRGRAA